MSKASAAADIKAKSSEIIAITGLKIAFTSVQLETLQSLSLKLVGEAAGLASGAAGATQDLLLAKGVIVTDVAADIPFSEMESALADVLETNRANCEGMDKVGDAVDGLLEGRATCGETETCSGFASLILSLNDLVAVSIESLEDSSIVTLSETIIKDITAIGSDVKISTTEISTIESLVVTIRTTVLTFVSQIALVEQRKLSVGGGLTFSTSLDDSASPEDQGKAELSGLMQ